MGDKNTLTAKLEAFMEQMAIRQQALEEQVAILSLLVQKITNGNSEKNNEEQGSKGGKKRNSDSQHGRSKNFFSSRPVTRSYAKAHNNLVSEPVVMGDKNTLTAKLEAFMEQMAIRQQALEEQVAILSLLVQKITNGNSEKNNEEQGSKGGKKGTQIRNTVGAWCHDTLRWNFSLMMVLKIL
ncbi:hypothetical protein GOBAR_DD04461 [Gossypium barbadense]|nr:hypothetical protein GOBAR_DD04461 [Gossypium barbadense]